MPLGQNKTTPKLILGFKKKILDSFITHLWKFHTGRRGGWSGYPKKSGTLPSWLIMRQTSIARLVQRSEVLSFVLINFAIAWMKQRSEVVSLAIINFIALLRKHQTSSPRFLTTIRPDMVSMNSLGFIFKYFLQIG